MKLKHTAALLALFVLAGSMTLPAAAQVRTVDPTAQFCFSQDDFTSAAADGIFLTSVPQETLATVRYGSRVLKAGDALPTEALGDLTLEAKCVTAQEVTIGYCTLSDGVLSGVQELKLSILPKEDQPPTAEDGSLETYKNIAGSGTLSAADPEGKPLTYNLVKEPKRGSVELHEDGTFTYTPDKNKVGKDSFTYTVTDSGGNTSEEAKISIEIRKPTDKATYADMDGDPDAFYAMWLKEAGLFTGATVGGNLCFEPEKTVSRGEFLVMVMKLVDAQADETGLTSGFSDEAATPVWLQPYIVSALGSGMISGVSSEDGVVFRPEAALSRAEAAVMLQNVLQLPAPTAKTVFSETDAAAVPAWAADATAALSAAGISLGDTAQADAITRREVAKLLYEVSNLIAGETLETFYWAQ
ncbi:MAG TPA: S-layer homology domain-containing protein [Candidatus Avoscillospira stercoripullorum]|uniref:S-layer homology domain-containing protein n=1 Tax=Candidatus Avoscillospira stercoripullorum TaxID=2840709 RepID=A0A9D1D8G9_9FIRM|nr:S-layer homology domain-containing protein [Candidatus Avoscillospira stercoripullorum]